jgi:hypothetical protein
MDPLPVIMPDEYAGLRKQQHGERFRALVFTDLAPPAQAVNLRYSLDADPAGIRARVADAITGTLWVASHGHTPPPVGHWLEPFWHAARADAASSLNATLRLR